MSLSLPTLTPTPSSPSAPAPTTTSTTPTTTSTRTSTSTSSPSTSTSTTPATTTTPSSTQTQTTSSTTSTTPTTQSSSSPSTTSTSSTPSSTSATPTPVLTTTDNSGSVITIFTTPTVTSTSSTSTNATTSSNSFFQNTGAVVGVFTVVGLIVVAIFIALVTNAIRRRRAQRFDRDVAEAAAEAAASSRSPFDDYTYSPNTGSGGGGGYGYSDTTHGTFTQAPMNLPSDVYGMSEMSQYDPYAAGAASLTAAAAVGRARSRQDSETRAPGIAGVGAGNLAREPSRKTPYHAFAGPGPQPHETLDHTPSMRYRRGADVLDAAGLSGTGVAAMTAANGGAYINRRPSEYTQHTHGSMRSHGHSSNENYPRPLQPGYQSPPRNDTNLSDAYAGLDNGPYPQRLPSPGPAFPISYQVSPPVHSHNPLSEVEGENFHDDAPAGHENRLSYADDDDYGQHNRVLRVANE